MQIPLTTITKEQEQEIELLVFQHGLGKLSDTLEKLAETIANGDTTKIPLWRFMAKKFNILADHNTYMVNFNEWHLYKTATNIVAYIDEDE